MTQHILRWCLKCRTAIYPTDSLTFQRLHDEGHCERPSDGADWVRVAHVADIIDSNVGEEETWQK